jgi:TrmH family RNA methyltransferase
MSERLPAVVLVRPTEEGNIGSVARAMANMGLEELILVSPRAQIGATARAFATQYGLPLLAEARVVDDLDTALAGFRRAVGTTSTRGARILAVTPLTPRQLPAVLATDPPGTATALVFGPERSGLEREELARLTPLVTVPCAIESPTLNLAQTVLLLAYELRLARLDKAGERVLPAGDPAAPLSELAAFGDDFETILRRVGFDRNSSFPGVMRDLRQMFARAAPTEREVAMLRGACRRIARAVGLGAEASDGA